MKIHKVESQPTSQQKLVRYASWFSIPNTLHNLDMFKKPLPVFNIKGRSVVPSYCGVFTSVLIVTILTIYGLSKFI